MANISALLDMTVDFHCAPFPDHVVFKINGLPIFGIKKQKTVRKKVIRELSSKSQQPPSDDTKSKSQRTNAPIDAHETAFGLVPQRQNRPMGRLV